MAQNQFVVGKDFSSKLPFKITPTKMGGVYLHPTPPADFDVQKATQDELTKQGLLWRKPTPNSPLPVHHTWNRFFSKNWDPKKRIVPEMVSMPGQVHYLKDTPVKQPTPAGQTNTTYLGTVWSGPGKNTGSWASIVGSWVIPTVHVPPEAQGTEGGWNSSSWVGLDGMFTSNDVLQAGIQQRISSTGVVSYVAWYEWYAPPVKGSPGYIYQTNISNFPVAPGQTVYCSVQYVGKTAGSISFANETTGAHFSITLAPPPGATFNGSSCEWIMEAPDGGEPTSSLPAFTPVVFTGALACSPGDTAVMIPGNCDIMNIRNAANKVLTNTTVNSETATITFIG